MSLPVPSEQTHLAHPKYRTDIDGLRAIAVLAVVGFHAFPYLVQGGFIGVDIFFVISGFLISSIIFENLHRDSFSFIEFYSRRIKRIFPALIVVLTASFVIGWFVLFADEYKQLGKHIAGGAGFIENFLLWRESGYFDNAAETKPLLHLWTLAIEEQYYIIWPLALWFAWKKRLNLLTIAIAVAIISFALNIGIVHRNTVAAFYSPQTRFWELMVGSVLAYIRLYKQNIFDAWLIAVVYDKASDSNPATLHNIQSLFGAVLIGAGILIIKKEFSFPGWWAVLPTMGAMLIISAGPHAWLNRAILSRKILVWFGLISYPLYLWHWPLLSFARIIEGETPERSIRIAAVLISVLLAWMTYRLIEKPIRFGKHSKTKTITLIFLIIVVGYAGYNSFERNGLEFRTIAKKSLDLVQKPDYSDYIRCQDKELSNPETLDWCFESAHLISNAAIIGDSHAEDKFLGIAKADKYRNWMFIGQNSCPPIYGVSFVGYVKGCQLKTELIIDWVSKSSDISLVALSFFGNSVLTTNYAADHIKLKMGPATSKMSSSEFIGKSKAEYFYYGLNKAITILENSGKKVVLMIDVPELPFFPRDCLRNPHQSICELTRMEVDKRQAEQRVLIGKLQQSHPSLAVFDPIKLFCDQNSCGFEDGKGILYRDSHHLTVYGGNLYAQHFIEWLDQSKKALPLNLNFQAPYP